MSTLRRETFQDSGVIYTVELGHPDGVFRVVNVNGMNVDEKIKVVGPKGVIPFSKMSKISRIEMVCAVMFKQF